jgi:hypothetical protein
VNRRRCWRRCLPQPAAAIELDLSYQSPFPEVQAQAQAPDSDCGPVRRGLLRPVRMAEGGDPQIEDKAAPLEGTGYVRGADLACFSQRKRTEGLYESLESCR